MDTRAKSSRRQKHRHRDAGKRYPRRPGKRVNGDETSALEKCKALNEAEAPDAYSQLTGL